MEQPADALQRAGHVLGAAHVAEDDVGRKSFEVAPGALGPGQHPHGHPLGLQRARHGGADEARGAGDQGDVR